MAKTKLALFEGSWQKVLIKVILLLLVLFVVYRILKGVADWDLFKKKPKSQEEIEEYITNVLPNTNPNDNSTPVDPDTISDADAELIANSMETSMIGTGTNEGAMFTALTGVNGENCLNGASLNKIYAKFGVRDYNGEMLDLYGWYGQELGSALFVTNVWSSDCVDGCTSWWDHCRDLDFMRAIWNKSSIPVNF